MEAEYVSRCKSINLRDLRCLSKELASSVAFMLNSLSMRCFAFVGSIWSSIARCIVLSVYLEGSRLKKGKIAIPLTAEASEFPCDTIL